MQAFSPLFSGAFRSETELFHTPDSVATLLAEALLPAAADADRFGSGLVRLHPSDADDLGTLFDRVVLTPSYGKAEGGQTENSAIRAGLARLRTGGHGLCVVSNGWLSRRRPDDIETRRLLTETCRLLRIVMLPPHAFQTQGKTSVLFWENTPPRADDSVLMTDLRGAEPGLALLPALCRAGETGARLTRAMLRTRDYILLPEEYRRQRRQDTPAQRLRSTEAALAEAYGEAEAERHIPEQMSLFAPAPAPIARDPDLLRRLLRLEYRRLDVLAEERLLALDCPYQRGRTLFTLKNGAENGETPGREGYPLYTAAGFSGFVRSANALHPPTLVISRVGTYCGEVYRVWEKCFVSANAMFLASIDDSISQDMLLLLLRCAQLNRLKRGSAQSYITQDAALERDYPVPSPAEQADMCALFSADFARIRALEEESISGGRRE